MKNDKEALKFFAQLLIEFKGYLSSNLAPPNGAPTPEHIAAHLAFAFHNEANASLDGKEFDLDSAWKKLEMLDTRFADNLVSRFRDSLQA